MEMIKLSSLKEHPDNPRILDKEGLHHLKGSIEEFTKMLSIRPIIIDEDRVILGGNMKKKALKALGYKEIPSDWVKQVFDLTEDEKREFIIKDNTHYGAWDWEELGNNWDGDELKVWGLDTPDFGDGLEEEDEEDQAQKDNTKNTPNVCPECGQKLPDDDVPF